MGAGKRITDYVAEDAPIVRRYEAALAHGAKVTGLSEQELADATAKAQELLRNKGRRSNLLELLTGGTKVVAEANGAITYMEAMAAVVALMTE